MGMKPHEALSGDWRLNLLRTRRGNFQGSKWSRRTPELWEARGPSLAPFPPYAMRFPYYFLNNRRPWPSLGHPQACVYSDACLRSDIISGKAPLLGQGIWWTPLPHPLPRRAAGQKLYESTRALALGEARYQIHRQSLNRHRVKHRSKGAQLSRIRSDQSRSLDEQAPGQWAVGASGWCHHSCPSAAHVPCKRLFFMQLLRLRDPGFRNRKPGVFINRPPKKPCKIPKDPPLLAWECIGVHSTLDDLQGQVLGGGIGGFGGGSGWQFMKLGVS